MAEGGSPGRRAPALGDRRDPTRGRHLTDPLEHLPAPRAGRVVRERGETAPERGGDPGRLTLHPDKTRFIDFRPQRRGGTHADCKDPPFDLLGFTHTWGKSRNGKNVVRQTTAKSRFARALLAVKDWCRTNRHRPILDQLARLSAKLVGLIAYSRITGQSRTRS